MAIHVVSASVPVALDPRLALRRTLAVNRPLALVGVGALLVLLGTLAGLAFDPRVITGAPAWLKPAKFALSIGLYSLTLLWLLGYIEGHRRLVRLIGNVIAVSFVVELTIIIMQVVRGTTSHFNVTSPLNDALYATMGVFIVAVWSMSLLAALLLLRQRLPDPAFAWALRLGLLLALIGAAEGVLMTRPSATQQAALAAGRHVTAIGAHSVGVADGGPGLPITGWSTVGGELRVAHFAGLHALQLMPLIGWFIARRKRLGCRQRVTLVWTAGLGYLGLILLLTWQALRGQALVAPDAATLVAAAGLATVVTVASAAILLHARLAPSHSRPDHQFGRRGV